MNTSSCSSAGTAFVALSYMDMACLDQTAPPAWRTTDRWLEKTKKEGKVMPACPAACMPEGYDSHLAEDAGQPCLDTTQTSPWLFPISFLPKIRDDFLNRERG